MNSRARILLVVAAMLMLGGCVRVDIGDSKPTLGQQMVDLYQARQAGAISESEFKTLRVKLFQSL